MMSKNLSYSAINTFSVCGQKYYKHYVKGLRSKYFHAALAFGSAIDKSLNELLLTKDLDKATTVFNKEWNFQWVNKKYTDLTNSDILVYAETDFDDDLLLPEDKTKLGDKYLTHYKNILSAKKNQGWDNLAPSNKQFYNYANWLSLRRKGHIMLNSYDAKVLPRIKEVLSVQKENYLQNSSGDKIVQYLDLIVRWEDGRVLLGDNKTSAKEYEPDSASRSPQLISYYHGAKEEFKIDSVAFFVLKKGIYKNKVKVCKVCGNNGTGGRHDTCNRTVDGTRCHGEWEISISPECDIQIIINDVSPVAENLVLESFNDANEGIKKENWYKNLNACKQGTFFCQFYKSCWFGDNTELVDMSKKE